MIHASISLFTHLQIQLCQLGCAIISRKEFWLPRWTERATTLYAESELMPPLLHHFSFHSHVASAAVSPWAAQHNVATKRQVRKRSGKPRASTQRPPRPREVDEMVFTALWNIIRTWARAHFHIPIPGEEGRIIWMNEEGTRGTWDAGLGTK